MTISFYCKCGAAALGRVEPDEGHGPGPRGAQGRRARVVRPGHRAARAGAGETDIGA